MKPIALYPTTITHAWSIADTGTRYTIEPISFPVVGDLIDKRDLDGFSEDPDRVLILREDAEVYLNKDDDIIVKIPEKAWGAVDWLLLSEVVHGDGTVLYREFGTTRKLVSGEETTSPTDIRVALQDRGNSAYVRDL